MITSTSPPLLISNLSLCCSHLERLLLYHGHLAYHRLSYTMNTFYFKCPALVSAQICLAFFSAFSQSTFTGSMLFLLYNMTMTALQTLLFGMFEKHLPEEDLVERPYLYRKVGFIAPSLCVCVVCSVSTYIFPEFPTRCSLIKKKCIHVTFAARFSKAIKCLAEIENRAWDIVVDSSIDGSCSDLA